MEYIDSSEAIINEIKKNDMLLLYFGTGACNVCVNLIPKLDILMKKYPKIKTLQVDSKKSVKISADYSVFTIPVMILFIEGKEVIREARHISMGEFDSKIARYYELFYD